MPLMNGYHNLNSQERQFMPDMMFSEKEMSQIKALGITEGQVLSQIETFKKGIPFIKLKRPCTLGDGVIKLQEDELNRLSDKYSDPLLSGRATKFVPASGAASRMFKLLLSINKRNDEIDEKSVSAQAEHDTDYQTFLLFIKGIKHFAFYDDLKNTMSRDGLDINDLVSNGQYKDILDYLLTDIGLDYAYLPKGLINFHKYPDHCRTPFEEHLVEAIAYTRDENGTCRIHFTVAEEHKDLIKDHLNKIRSLYETTGTRFEISCSIQKPSTNTIAVDMDNKPFRAEDGRIVFRPGGHGALLENLSNLKGDIIFIKNIDNVVPDRIKPESHIYKKAFGGYLTELQKETSGYLERLAGKTADDKLIKHAFEFAKEKLFVDIPYGIDKASNAEKTDFIFSRLNRPIRICGVVKNVGEPGGGPFWIEDGTQVASLQIVEESQVDMKSKEQRTIWESSSYFNPVDLVCGAKDYLGMPFDLLNYANHDAGFISIKSKEGRDLKALELPGLWNGSMAYWNTIFIEVPLITFNPVKTVMDLLRKEHQPA